MIRYALPSLMGILIAVAAHADPAPDIAARLDLCALGAASNPAKLFPKYSDQKYQNSALDLPGQSVFFDQPSLFRCGDYPFADGKDKGTYSTDNVIFVTTPDEKSIRAVLVNMGMVEHMQGFIDFIEKTYGPGKVLRSSVKSKGERKGGEEIRLIETPTHNYYLDIVYFGVPVPAGTLVVVDKADAEANKNVAQPKP
jgi:hypothetical protein